MDMFNVLVWIKAHWQDFVNIITYVVTACSVIAKLTPNKWDDALVKRVITLLSLNVTR